MSKKLAGDYWESVYRDGEQLNRYPFSTVCSFVFRYLPRGVPRSEVRILEVGFGAGNNLWFAAREGLSVAGVERSPTAVKYARQRFLDDGLDPSGLQEGSFTDLPFDSESFDLAIDRRALTYANFEGCRRAVAEVGRTLKPGAFFYSELYGDRTTFTGPRDDSGILLNAEGALARHGAVCSYSRAQAEALYPPPWRIQELEYTEHSALHRTPSEIIATWSIIAQKS